MLRPYQPRDADAFLSLHNRADGLNVPLARFLEQEANLKCWRQLAETEGRLSGMAELRPFDYLPPDWLRLSLYASPESRGRGVGAALLAWALEQARTLGAPGVAANVLDDDPDRRAWAERRGFRLHAHRFASELDLSRPHPAPEWPEGVTVRDMTAATATDWERLETLYGDLLTQTPDLEGQPRWTPEQLRTHLRGNPRLRPDWHLVAADAAGHWLGLCHGLPISSGIYNEFTAVIPAARGRGLARALKLELIRRARAEGVGLMRTNNHASNLPMLSVNRRLGFVAQTGSWELRRELR